MQGWISRQHLDRNEFKLFSGKENPVGVHAYREVHLRPSSVIHPHLQHQYHPPTTNLSEIQIHKATLSEAR